MKEKREKKATKDKVVRKRLLPDMEDVENDLKILKKQVRGMLLMMMSPWGPFHRSGNQEELQKLESLRKEFKVGMNRLKRQDGMPVVYCGGCKKETAHKHLIDSPYGITEAYMAGSERYECCECGRAIRSGDEAEELGLQFEYEG